MSPRRISAFLRFGASAGLIGLVLLAAGCSTGEDPLVEDPPPGDALRLAAILPTAGGLDATAAPATQAVAARRAPSAPAPDALDPFYAQLARLEGGGAGPLRILQLGDSHTAGDVMSGRLRTLFQQRFGAAGRGLMVPGHAYDGLRQAEVRVSQSGRWSYANSLPASSTGIFGITGFRALSRSPGARLILDANEAEGFDRVAVEILHHPAGGRLDISVDGRPIRRVATAGAEGQSETVSLTVAKGSHHLELVAIDRAPVELLAWSVERSGRGVVYESAGVSGATAALIQRWSPDIATREIAERRPALIVLAYGANESVQHDFDAAKYADIIAGDLRLAHRAAPNAAVLLVGPPDTDVLPSHCQVSARNQPLACSAAPEPSDGRSLCRWHPAPNLAAVAEIQRRVAGEQGAAYWDWSAVMGGACGAHRWAVADPPLGRADHVHQTLAGYTLSGDALFAWLIDGYDAYKARRGIGRSPVGRSPVGRAG